MVKKSDETGRRGAAPADRPAGRKRRRWKRWGGALLALFLAAVVGVELYARFGLGLGDPPLYQRHETIEYLCKPGVYHRFGNVVRVNRFHMRSGPVEPERREGRSRVLVLGDSVVHGGNLTDHGELATTILQRRLSADRGGEVFVGNVSAGSWGPANLLAYLQTFGTFDAEVVVFVLSSHDAEDVPTFRPLNPVKMPTRSPVLALQEAVGRYFVTWVKYRFGGGRADHAEQLEAQMEGEIDLRAVARCEAALQEAILMTRERGAEALVALHPSYLELERGDLPGKRRLARTASASGARVIDLRPAYIEALRAGKDLYRDFIHLDPPGQALLAEALEQAIAERLP